MPAQFMDKNFLLHTETAKTLFFSHAEKMPIVDYHCHVNPQEIAEDRRFDNIAQVWLGGDHYKWRLMRANGVPEEKITGSAPDREKFQAWAEALERAVGNPLYHWTHLELQRYFDYHGVLNGDTAEEVWNLCNKKLASPGMSVREIIKKSNVAALCTTDDPVDDLRWHEKLAKDSSWSIPVLPSWRPDKAVNIDKPGFGEYIGTLSQVAGVEIRDITTLLNALKARLDYFGEQGCKVSDHGLDKVFCTPCTKEEADSILLAALSGKPVSGEQADKYKTCLLLWLGKEYAERGWGMQLHFAAGRNLNSNMFEKLGPDTGFDAIGKGIDVGALGHFLDALEQEGKLPKTVVYSLNPGDEQAIAATIGSFQGVGMRNKMQLGVPWWFNDTKSGMEQGLINLANATVLGNFIGMLTDSRSFLSYPRHEYFRRILCATLGDWVEKGEIPNDEKLLGGMVEDICFNNVNAYFEFKL